jgi:acyl dehydratase
MGGADPLVEGFPMTDPSGLNEEGFAALAAGDVVGTSEWVTVDQRLLDQFGSATLDDDPMHLDPEWARETGPFGTTVAFGFWTMSLLTHLLHSAMKTAPVCTAVTNQATGLSVMCR